MRIIDWSSDVCSSDLLVEPERDARIGRRAVLAVRWRGEGDTAGDDASQRLRTELNPRQTGIHGDAAGIPESRVFAHQMGVLRLDIQLHLDAIGRASCRT